MPITRGLLDNYLTDAFNILARSLTRLSKHLSRRLWKYHFTYFSQEAQLNVVSLVIFMIYIIGIHIQNIIYDLTYRMISDSKE